MVDLIILEEGATQALVPWEIDNRMATAAPKVFMVMLFVLFDGDW